MKTLVILAVAAALLLATLPGESLVRRAMRVVGGGNYVLGEVLSVEKVACGRGGRHGVHLLLKTADGKVSVSLGPSWYLDRQTMKVTPHDVIRVGGSLVTCEGRPTLIATVIRKGSERLRLRAADGTPLWLASRAR